MGTEQMNIDAIQRWKSMVARGLAALLALAVSGAAQARETRIWRFEDAAIGGLPAGWQAGATNPQGKLETWAVVRDRSAPSPDHALAMKQPGESNPFGRYGGMFNLCWTHSLAFRDGEIQVRFKAVSGREDQGGGIIWRVRDSNNYYVARFNPLEDNFRLYFVRNGHRKTLASAQVSLSAGQWHGMKIVQRGNHYSAWLDGKKWLEGSSDEFPDAGGVGVWTKADAVTEFDDFSVAAQ